jgi:putative CocE/NonD family hydrolase
VHPGVDYPQPNGIFLSYALRWLNLVTGKAANDGVFGATGLWLNAEWQQITTGRAFADLEAITGATGTVFKTWLAHPREDAYWQAITPRAEQYAKLQLPILTITGHYDDDQLGALTYYDRFMAAASQEERARHWLVIGPWDHSGTRRPQSALGGVSFGPAATMSMEALHKAWYDHVLKHGPRPAFLKDRVAVFVMGKNEWIYAADLKQVEGAPLKLDLDVGGATPGDVTRSGRLVAGAVTAASTILTSDPKYLPPREELESEDDSQALRDQRDTYRDLHGQVVLHGAPLAAETVIAGRPKIHVQVAVDQPDADLAFELDEVLPDGSIVILSNATIRLRYRKGGVAAVPMVPGKPELVDVPGMNFVARALAKGSRLRLVVNAGPHFGSQRNSHTGGDLATEPASAGRVAKVTIMTGPKTGSAIELPRPDKAVLDTHP